MEEDRGQMQSEVEKNEKNGKKGKKDIKSMSW